MGATTAVDPHEAAMRLAKATRLADAFTAGVRLLHPEAEAPLIAGAGHEASDDVWRTIAARLDMRRPSDRTLELARHALDLRANAAGKDVWAGLR